MDRNTTISELKILADEIKYNLANSRKPLIVEFSGLPKSGKTTIINSLALFLRRNNISVKVITERASICPVKNKKHMFFNVWTGCSSLLKIFEELEDDNLNVIILDRGTYDSIIWLNVLKDLGRIEDDDLNTITKFLLLDSWRNKIDIIIHMTATVEKALEREYQNLLTDIPGTIMTKEVLTKYLEASKKVSDNISKKFKMYFEVDTTKNSIGNNIKKITVEILNKLKTLSDEELVVISKKNFKKYVNISDFKKDDTLLSFIEKIMLDEPLYDYRSKIEENNNVIQLIPAAIIIYRGKILITTKHEINEKGRMHNKKCIWLGGHLRKEDMSLGSFSESVKRCIARELKEEIDFNKISNIEFTGLVYDQTNTKSLQHLGVIFTIKVPDNYNIQYLIESSFYERTGQGVSTNFYDLTFDEMSEFKNEFEKWSLTLLKNCYNIKLSSSENNQLQMF